MRLAVGALLAGAALCSPAFALTEPTPDAPSEPRMRHVEYVPDDIVKIAVPADGETQIVLSPDDGKIAFSVPQKAWRHARAGNTLVIAPNPGATTTLAHIVSTLPDGKTRTYTLELSVAQGQSGSAQVASLGGAVPQNSAPAGYASVRFTYTAAEKEAKAAAAAAAKQAAIAEARARRAAFVQSQPPVVRAKAPVMEHRRCDFMWRGSPELLPQAACDGGTMTTFLWGGQVSVPAIFVVTPDGREQSVTQSPDPLRPGLVIVPMTAQRWVLRSGPKSVVELYNAAYDPLATENAASPVSTAQVQR